MNKQLMVKWELAEQVVWLVALAAAVVILLLQASNAPAQIPVTGVKSPGAMRDVVMENPHGMCLEESQSEFAHGKMDITY